MGALSGAPGLPLLIAGYAALFGIRDRGGDILAPGAFAATLADRRAVPLFWQHRPEARIGDVLALAEDARGLRCIARLDGAGPAAALVAARAVTGLSFGYRVRASAGGPTRRLLAVDLVEISVVTRPMQPRARIHWVSGGSASATRPSAKERP